MLFRRRRPHYAYSNDYGGNHPYEEFLIGLAYLLRNDPGNSAIGILSSFALPEGKDAALHATGSDAKRDCARVVRNILSHAAAHHHRPYDSYPFTQHQQELIHTMLHTIAKDHVGVDAAVKEAKRIELNEKLMIEVLKQSGRPDMMILGDALQEISRVFARRRHAHLTYLREHESEWILAEEETLWKEFHDNFMDDLKPVIDMFQTDFRSFDFVEGRGWGDYRNKNISKDTMER